VLIEFIEFIGSIESIESIDVSGKPVGDISGPIRQHDVGSGPPDAGERLQCGRPAVDPVRKT